MGKKKLCQRQLNSASNNTASYQTYMDKDREVICSAQRDKREWLNYQAEKAEETAVHNDMRFVYHTVENHQHYPFTI